MSTVYTLNGKVLKNAANDKWLAKKEAPAGFVMNASNATIVNNSANWEGPNYPDGYDGTGKTLQIIVKEEGFTCYALKLQYTNTMGVNGPGLVVDTNSGQWVNPTGDPNASIPVGTYNVDILQNPNTSSFGKYIIFTRIGPDQSLDSAMLSKLEFRIID